MNKYIAILCFSVVGPLIADAQTNYALQVKKDSVKINATNLSVENNINIKNDIVLTKFKNNEAGDSVLTTDANGKLKFKQVNTNNERLFK